MENVKDIDSTCRNGFYTRNIARRTLHVHRFVRRDEEALCIHTEVAQELHRCLRLRRIEIEVIENDEIARAHLVGERTLQGETALLARHREAVLARMRSKDRAAADPQRAARRTCTGTTRSLLTPRLASAAAHETARLRGMRAETLRRELEDNRLMKEAGIHFNIEERIVQADLANLVVRHIIDCYICHTAIPPSLFFRCLCRLYGIFNHNESLLRARNRALDENEVAVGVHTDDRQTLHGDALAAHAARELLAL